MTFKEKYKKLQNPNYVIVIIMKSAYGTMHLEGQGMTKAETQNC